MVNLIGAVTVTPPNAVPGQSVLVQVLDPSGAPYTNDSDVVIALDGIPVSSRYYQFPTAGTRMIAVYAAGRGSTETTTATVNVTGAPMVYHRILPPAGEPPAPALIPFIVMTHDLYRPYEVTFSLATPPAAGAAAARALAAADEANAGDQAQAPTAAQTAPAGFLALQAHFRAEPAGLATASMQHLVLEEPVIPPPSGTSYVWTFGDGQTATTDSPIVVHDYFPAITPGRVPFAFDVQCQIVHNSISVTRTFVVYSAYGMCQRNGMTVPNATGDTYATLSSDRASFSASVLVFNIEAAEMTIDQVAIVPVWSDEAASFPAFVFKKMTQPVTIAPHSSSLLAVQVHRGDLSSAARGAAVAGFIMAFQGTLSFPLTLPSVHVALRTQLRPGGIAIPTVVTSSVRFSRHVRLHLQDQQLPPRLPVMFPPRRLLLDSLSKAPGMTVPVVRSGGLAVDPATNVISVALTAPAPTAAQAAQVRHSVLAALSAANIARGT
jgi:hypothetical protein